jgi:hypothetical protein
LSSFEPATTPVALEEIAVSSALSTSVESPLIDDEKVAIVLFFSPTLQSRFRLPGLRREKIRLPLKKQYTKLLLLLTGVKGILTEKQKGEKTVSSF